MTATLTSVSNPYATGTTGGSGAANTATTEWYSINVIGQTGTTEDNYRSQPKSRMISMPTATSSIPAGISPTTIEIDR